MVSFEKSAVRGECGVLHDAHLPYMEVAPKPGMAFSRWGRKVCASGTDQGVSQYTTLDCVPRRWLYFPVINAEREGEHSGLV